VFSYKKRASGPRKFPVEEGETPIARVQAS